MKNTIALCLMLLLSSASANAAEDALLKIELTGLASAEGSVYISVYSNPDDWLSESTVARMEVVIGDALVDDLVVADIQLPPGEYAISMYYDANGNGEMDTNFIGIPKEPVALSNNAKAKFGPPKYKDAVFSLPAEGLTQQIAITEI
ncbi:MAG: DUF2141 domain-containing protein [Halioglobus sp.]